MLRDPVPIVVDMQKDFCRPGFAFDAGTVDHDHIGTAVEQTGTFLARARAAGHTPLLVRTIHSDEVDSPVWIERYAESRFDRPCLPGTEGAAFCDPLDASDGDTIITKHRYDAFHGTRLHDVLQEHDVSEIVLAGVLTDVCVEYTAQSAYNHDYRVTVLSDCTASRTPDAHRVALGKMGNVVGTVRTSDDITF